MYNQSYRCTYNIAECGEQDIIYQKDVLGIFGLDEFEDKAINDSVADLYERVKSCEELQECMKQCAALFMSEDPMTGLMVLFSFDYMHITHLCLVGYLEQNEELFRNRLDKLKSKLSLL